MTEDELFEVTKTLNNMKKHDYTVADYRMCKKEADIVMPLLAKRKVELENETTV